jgi:hypothetical protein
MTQKSKQDAKTSNAQTTQPEVPNAAPEAAPPGAPLNVAPGTEMWPGNVPAQQNPTSAELEQAQRNASGDGSGE